MHRGEWGSGGGGGERKQKKKQGKITTVKGRDKVYKKDITTITRNT